VSWLVDTCHARTICECCRVPRSSTPLVKTALPRRAVREPGYWHRQVTRTAWEDGGRRCTQS
jgi:hypothetical protein